MKVFTLSEFADENYQGTLFSELVVVDDRNPELIAREGIPPSSRVMAFRSAARYSIWPAYKLDGSPDYRHNPIAVGGGDTWVLLSVIINELERARAMGDILLTPTSRAIPIRATQWPKCGELISAAVLTSIQGWGLPVYFAGAFEYFHRAVERLLCLQKEISLGTAEYGYLYLDSE